MMFYGKKHIFSPVTIFLLIQTLMFLGSFQYIDFRYESDRYHIFLLFLVFIFFILGVFISNNIFGKSQKQSVFLVEKLNVFNKSIIALWSLSIILSILYYNAIGYNVFLLSITNMGSDMDVTTLRLSSYAGEKYFAPGYINQFKNMIFPLILIFFGLRYYIQKNKKDLLFFWISFPLTLLFILGTGQREAFIIIVIISLSAIYFTLSKKDFRKLFKIISIVTIFLFSLSTVILARGELSTGISISNILNSVIERFTSNNQRASVIGFRYIYSLDVQFGQDWLNSFTSLLPGQGSGINIANEIFYIFYNSYRGTSPPSLWGSTWYNFGFLGCIIFACLLGYIYQYVYLRFINKKTTLFRNIYYSGVFIVLGTWIAGGPTTILNNGAPGILLLIFIHKLFVRIKSSA
jgi:oligosaccharide repeat unit polymerase